MNTHLKKIGKNIVTKFYDLITPDPFLLNPAQEWDVLIIFDACRYDLFKKYNVFEGDLDKVFSPGSCTGEWFNKTFAGKKFNEITYISANPVVSNFLVKKNHGEIPFKEIIDLWKYGWSEKENTVKPSIVNQVASNFLNKTEGKIIIHYLQPHYPFIGSHKLPNSSMNNLKRQVENEAMGGNFNNISPWAEAKKGNIALDEIILAYESNVEYIFSKTMDFIESIEKSVFITSDHGNTYGTLNAFGHPCNFHIPELIEVPLLKIYN